MAIDQETGAKTVSIPWARVSQGLSGMQDRVGSLPVRFVFDFLLSSRCVGFRVKVCLYDISLPGVSGRGVNPCLPDQ